MANILVFPSWLDSRYEDVDLIGNQNITSGQHTLINFSVPAGERYYPVNVHVSADAEATFLVYVNGDLVKRIKTSATHRSADSDFGGAFKKVLSGTPIKVDVFLDEEDLSSIPTFVCITGFKETLT